jgi:hypothetical protein
MKYLGIHRKGWFKGSCYQSEYAYTQRTGKNTIVEYYHFWDTRTGFENDAPKEGDEPDVNFIRRAARAFGLNPGKSGRPKSK